MSVKGSVVIKMPSVSSNSGTVISHFGKVCCCDLGTRCRHSHRSNSGCGVREKAAFEPEVTEQPDGTIGDCSGHKYTGVTEPMVKQQCERHVNNEHAQER